MKSLIIIANPSKTSFSHALADAYAQWAQSIGKVVEMLDLYDLDQPLLRYESVAALKQWKINEDPKRALVQQKISESDEMIYIFPVRWGGLPAILKNFFDTNFGTWFAFEFVEGSSKQKKLLTDKTAKIYAHCDAPSFVYQMSIMWGINIKKYLSSLILWFCGIKVTDYKLFGKLRESTESIREEYLWVVRASWAKW